MTGNKDDASIARALVKGDPLSFKAYPDGRLVVIGPTGQKFTFTSGEVQIVKQALCTQKAVESVPKKVSRTRKTPQNAPPKES
jgi:hypothetical protein